MSLLREALVALTYPLALTLAVLLVALVLQKLRWKRTAGVLALGAFAWSAFCSIPNNAEWLRSSLEDRYVVAPDPASLPNADAIVVLGGGGYTWVDRPGVTLDKLKYSRLAAGVRLYEIGRAHV